MRWILCCIAALLLSLAGAYAVDGTFQGKVVDAPEGAPAIPGGIYIQGRNRLLRRVEVAQAEIVFSNAIPENQRGAANPGRLAAATAVLVRAEQDGSGEMHAKRVEILQLSTSLNKTQRIKP